MNIQVCSKIFSILLKVMIMARKKIERFREMKHMPNVFEPDSKHCPKGTEPVELKGKWRSEVFPVTYDIGLAREADFPATNPLILELGCGRGDYVMALADRFPDRNYVGVDVKGARMWKGATEAMAHRLKNVAFLRMRIEDMEDQFEENEVNEIWVTFADPFPPDRRENRRLTSPRFLEMYKRILREDGKLHIKHDNEEFFDYSKGKIEEAGFEIVREVRDLYSGDSDSLLTEIQTTYEKRHLAEGRKIYYLEASS
jgi:tRNA (guanine-N7-)-methyltransferase